MKTKYKKQPEFELQCRVAKYLRLKYPKVYFMSDTIASVRLDYGQAGRNKSIQCDKFKCPDLIIFEPRKGYHGLFIELKIKSPYLKTGELSTNEHIQGQAQTINRLNYMGYKALFAWDFDEITKIIDEYLND